MKRAKRMAVLRSDPRQGLLSLKDAARDGVRRLRISTWKNRLDHIEIDIIDGEPGVWISFYSPMNAGLDQPDPVKGLIFEFPSDNAFIPYTGPLPDSKEYENEAASWNERFKP